jgi:hypothetical protein
MFLKELILVFLFSFFFAKNTPQSVCVLLPQAFCAGLNKQTFFVGTQFCQVKRFKRHGPLVLRQQLDFPERIVLPVPTGPFFIQAVYASGRPSRNSSS